MFFNVEISSQNLSTAALEIDLYFQFVRHFPHKWQPIKILIDRVAEVHKNLIYPVSVSVSSTISSIIEPIAYVKNKNICRHLKWEFIVSKANNSHKSQNWYSKFGSLGKLGLLKWKNTLQTFQWKGVWQIKFPHFSTSLRNKK